jgi:hypothetical protein
MPIKKPRDLIQTGQKRSFCPQSLRSFGRIENLQIASTAIENGDTAAASICKITAAPTSEAGKYEYFQTLGTPSKIRVLVVLRGRLHNLPSSPATGSAHRAAR